MTQQTVFFAGEHKYRPTILPVSDPRPRPRWSVMIPTFNCAGYLRETLQSVLSQDPGSSVMQIEVVDDCSTRDDPAAVVAEIGRGRVLFYRQSQNVGHVDNFNTCIQRAQGELVHILHGDDLVQEGFYRALNRAFEVKPHIGAAFCRYIAVDEHGQQRSIAPIEQDESGIVSNWLWKIGSGQRLQPPAIVVRRDVYEQLGGYDRRIQAYGEDWEMWIRIAAFFQVWYEPQPLAVYRVRSSSLSGRTLRTGENMKDLHRVMRIAQAYLPPEHAESIISTARHASAQAALRRAKRALFAGDVVTPLAQMRAALGMSTSPDVLARFFLVGTQYGAFVLPITALKLLRQLRVQVLRQDDRATRGTGKS